MGPHNKPPVNSSVFDKDLSLQKVNDYILTSDITRKIRFSPQKMSDIRNFFSVPKENRETILCSVRKQEGFENEKILDYVSDQSKKGIHCYYPLTYNFQKDDYKGLVICNTMRFVIKNSGKVSIFYNPASEGTKFDAGISLYVKGTSQDLDINLELMDGFEADSLFSALDNIQKDPLRLESFIREHEDIFNSETISYEHVLNDKGKMSPDCALKFGMVFGSEKPFKIMNLDDAIIASGLEKDISGNPISKSYTKVALLLHDIYNAEKL